MNCTEHVEFYSKNKFEKSVHLVDFIIRIYHDARSPERQIPFVNVRIKVKWLEAAGIVALFISSASVTVMRLEEVTHYSTKIWET